MAHDHDHHDHHHHEHDNHLTAVEARVKALETLMVAKGYVDPAALDAIVDTYETKIGPRNGARIVAKAWTDPAYAERLKADGTAAVAELGYGGRGGEHIVAAFNTPEEHNLVVCTLCSCYPWPVLGLPPVWYKSPPYRAKAVIDPRGTLADFGVTLPEGQRVRVWDSTAETRFIVIPMRPEGTQRWSEEDLAAIVTRDSMIGTAVLGPESRP